METYYPIFHNPYKGNVSEELSSVETFAGDFDIHEWLEFQKNLVVWKRCSFGSVAIYLNTFQKNLVVWKRFYIASKMLTRFEGVSEELSSVETVSILSNSFSIIDVSEELSSVETRLYPPQVSIQ